MHKHVVVWFAVVSAIFVLTGGCSLPPEQQAVEAVESVGGRVKLDADGQVVEVDVSRTPADDELLSLLSALPRLTLINCSETRIKGDGLASLNNLKQLKSLYLVGCDVNDRGGRNPESRVTLETLHVGRTQLTDEGLSGLRHLTKLRTLSLGHTAVTDAGLIHLRSMHDLGTLILHHTKVTKGGVRDLQRSMPDARIDL